MNLLVNGDATEVPEEVTIDEIVTGAGARGRRGVAVALNGAVVPRGEWASKRLTEGDRVEVLSAIGGG